MAFKAELCKTWVEAQAGPGEQYVTHVVTSTNTPLVPNSVGMNSNINFSRTEAIREVASQLGLEDENKVGFLVSNTFLALTGQSVFYGSRSSFRDRPKDLLHQAPLSDFTLYWVDDDIGSGNTFRHMLLDFGGGAWRTDRIGLTALKKDMSHRTNVHEFFEVLGDRAREVGPPS